MRNIYLMTKNYFHCAIGTLFGKKKRMTNMAGITLILLLVGGLFALLLFTSVKPAIDQYMMMENYYLEETGVFVPLMKLILNSGFLMGAFIAVMMALMKVTGGQRANDADLLLSMPCSRFEIVTAKAISKYFFNLALMFLFAGPYILGYLIFYQFSLTVLFGSILAFLFVPFIAVGLSYILDYITTILFSKAAMGNLLKAALTLIVLIGFMIFYLSSQLSAFSGLEGLDQEAIIGALPPIMWMVKIAVSFDAVSILLLAAVTIPVFVVGISLFATTFDKQNQVSHRRKVDIADQPNSSPMVSILKKEFNKFINTPVWIINSILGVLMIIGLTIWVAFDSSMVLEMAELMVPDKVNEAVAFFLTAALSMSSALSLISCATISLEGRSFWALKTTPADARVVITGKAMLNMVLVTPVVVLSSIALTFIFSLTFLQFLVLLLCPLLVNIFVSFGGVFINLLYPKFDWESETAAIKQSMSVIISMLAGTVLALIPLIPLITSKGLSVIPFIGWVMLIAYTLFAAGAVALALTKGKTLYEKL